MNRTTWKSLIAALVFSAVGMAGAQSIESTPDTVVYSVQGGVKFEDNRDAIDSNKESMVTLSVTPGVQLNLDDETTKAFFYYKPSLLWRDNPRDDQNDSELYHAAEAHVEHQASGRLKVGALDRFEMTDDPNVTAGGVTIRENASYWVNQSRGWMAYLLSDRLQADFDASYLVKRYEDSTFSRLADEERLLANLGLRYRLEPDFDTFGFVGYDQPTFRDEVRGDYRGYLAGAGLSRTFSDTLKGSVAGGYKFLDYSDAAESDDGMPFVQLAGEYRATQRLQVQAQADYSLEPSDRTFYSSKEYTKLMLRGGFELVENLIAQAQVVYANGAYEASSAIKERKDLTQPVVNGDDTLMDYQVGLEFRPKARRYYGRVAYEYEDWTSDVRESFTRNTVSATVGMEF